jgi:hypothetical protein
MAARMQLSRRDWLTLSSAGVLGCSLSGWMEALAAETEGQPRRHKACILLWMNGGPSQTDTFDLKPGHANGGPFRPIQTSVPDIHISEHLPRLAQQMRDMVLIRAMSTREGDHGRGTFLMRTGYLPQGPIHYPAIGSLISKELGRDDAALPNFVSIAPYRQFNPAAYGPGFLGPQYAPLLVGDAQNFQPVPQRDYTGALRVQDMAPPQEVTNRQFDARVSILEDMERDFVARHPGVSPQSHRTAYDRAVRLMRTAARTAFNIDEEPAHIRDGYGRTLFGQGCLLARRLVERGVPFVEVSLGAIPQVPVGWDTHGQNFNNVRLLSEVLDPAWAYLMTDLRQRGLLDDTLIVWMGEFGRTPRINQQQGRDHFPNAWTTVLAGGGIQGGRVVGRTSSDGMTVEAPRPIAVPDFLATVCRALGINYGETHNMSNVGRPIGIVDHGAQHLADVVA